MYGNVYFTRASHWRPAANAQSAPIASVGGSDWMTAGETVLELGCSVATVHRLRRGLFPGIEPLPFFQYGRKIIFRRSSVAGWRERNEKGRLAA